MGIEVEKILESVLPKRDCARKIMRVLVGSANRMSTDSIFKRLNSDNTKKSVEDNLPSKYALKTIENNLTYLAKYGLVDFIEDETIIWGKKPHLSQPTDKFLDAICKDPYWGISYDIKKKPFWYYDPARAFPADYGMGIEIVSPEEAKRRQEEGKNTE
jgi:hypothetical protein